MVRSSGKMKREKKDVLFTQSKASGRERRLYVLFIKFRKRWTKRKEKEMDGSKEGEKKKMRWGEGEILGVTWISRDDTRDGPHGRLDAPETSTLGE